MDTYNEGRCLLKGLRENKNEVYQRDVGVLTKYREDFYKITLHKYLRRAGYEAADGEPEKCKKNTAGNTSKLDESLSRTKATIFELAMCNEWEWFVTLTIDPKQFDREDLNQYKKKLSVWIKNYNRLHGTKIKYLLIPELHNDRKSWHMHGLVMELPETHLTEFEDNETLPLTILIEIKRGNKVYDWPAYRKAFGYITITKIRNAESVSKYISKYITKDLIKTKIELNNHLYYCSKGLKRAKKLYQGQLTKDFDEDFGNEYVKIKTLRSFGEAIHYFVDE